MRRLTARTLVLVAVALAVVVGAGTAVAASGGGSSPTSFLDSLAKHLGISRDTLDDAVRAAAVDQVEAALADGKITKEQADELKERIESDAPLFGLGIGRGPGFGFGPGFGPGHVHVFAGPAGLEAAAEYLGLTESELRDRLADGRTLAEVAKAEGRSVDGLEQALVADAKERLDEAVENGRLTRAQADDLLEHYRDRVDDVVTGARVERERGLFGPPGMDWEPRMRITPGVFESPPAGGDPA